MGNRRELRRQRRQLATEAGQAVSIHPAAVELDEAMRRHPSNQAPGARAGRPVSAGRQRRGLVTRAKAYLARRYLDKLGPAIVPPIVAGAVVLVTVGVLVGLALGVVVAGLGRSLDRIDPWGD